MQDKAAVAFMRVLIDVVDAAGIKGRRAALDAMDDIAFFQQQVRQLGAVLPGYARDECDFFGHVIS